MISHQIIVCANTYYKASEYDQEILQSINHTLQTNPRDCEEEPQNNNSHHTPGKQ